MEMMESRFRASRSRSCIGDSPNSMWATMFSSMTMASSTRNHRKCQRHERQVVEAVIQQGHYGKCADDGHRQRQTGINVAERLRKIKYHQDHQTHRQHQREFHIMYGLDGWTRTVEKISRLMLEAAGCGNAAQVFDRVHHIHGVDAGLTLHRRRWRGLLLNQLAPCCLHAARHFPTPPGEPGDLCDRRRSTRKSAASEAGRWLAP